MRKIMMMLLVLAMTVCGAVGIAACGKDPDPEQNQGQVEQNKDKDKEEENKPNQNQGNENKEDEGKEDEEGETGNENPTNPGQSGAPETPEDKKPNSENPPKEDDKQQEEDKKDEDNKEEDKDDGKEEDKDDGKEEEPPQGDQPGTGDSDEGKTDPTPDNPTKPDDKEPETKPSEPDKKPETAKCAHKWTYTVSGDTLRWRKHTGTCSLCGATQEEKCTFGEPKLISETCTEDGYNLYTCAVCKNDLKLNIYEGVVQTHKATGHEFEEKYTFIEGSDPCRHKRKCINPGCSVEEVEDCTLKAASLVMCQGEGADKICPDCGHEVKGTGSEDSRGHLLAYKEVNYIQHMLYCTREGCNYKKTENCTYQTTEKVDATCTERGKEVKMCACGHKEVTGFPATGHKINEITGSNYKGHKGTCTVCGEKDVTIPHEFGDTNLCKFCDFDGINDGYTGILTVSVKQNDLCRKKKVVVLSDNPLSSGYTLVKIGSNTFTGNKNLETVYIPSSVTTIEAGAFSGCTNLKKVYFGGQQDADKKLENKIKSDLNGGNDISFEYEKTRKEVIEAVKKENPSSFETLPAVLPVEAGKRVYA